MNRMLLRSLLATCLLAMLSAGLTTGALAQETGNLQLPDLLGQGDSPFGQTEKADVKPYVVLEPADGASGSVKPGDEVVLSVILRLPPKSYTYSTDRSYDGRTKFEVQAAGLEAIDKEFQADKPPKRVHEPLLPGNPILEKFFNDVTWSKRYRVTNDATGERVSVSGKMTYSVCDDTTCRYFKEEIAASLPLVGGSAAKRGSFAKHPFQKEIVPEGPGGQPQPITFTFKLSPESARPGDEVTLSVTAVPEGTWHIYAMTHDPAKASGTGRPTRIAVDEVNGLKAVDAEFSPDETPETLSIPELENAVQIVHHHAVTWTKRFTVGDNAAENGYGLSGKIRYMICNEATCLPPKTLEFALGTVEETLIAVAPSVPAAPSGPVETAEAQKETKAETAATDDGEVTKKGLVPFLLAAVAAGFAALLTPCVFPMVPITVSFFLKQSEKEHHRPLTMALVYCFGIVGAFTVIGLLMAVIFGATSLNELANGPILNLFIAGVLVFFGMNLLGLFEIRIPSWLLTWSSTKEGQGGFAGVLFMALTFTLVSFTCTFAFVGFLLVLAAKGDFYWPVLGLAAFSAAFALPFFFLALFPSYLQKLPKSGGWMNNVKVTMGMIELGAAFKFLSVADLAWFPEAFLFDYSLVMSGWIVISICTGLYLLGVFRLPHDTPTENVSVIRLAFAMTFLGLAGYLSVGLFSAEKPTGKLWEQIAAFAPPNYKSGSGEDIGPYLNHDGLQYALDFERAFQVAEQRNQPVFVDITGENCLNCRLMEKRMEDPELRKRLEQFVRVQVYMDSVPTVPREQEQQLLKKNRQLQTEWFGDVTLPSYAVVTPDRRILTRVTGQKSKEIFARFLDEGLARWQSKPTGTAAEQVALQGMLEE